MGSEMCIRDRMEQVKTRFPFKSFTCKVVGLSILNFPLNCSPPLLHREEVVHKSNSISESLFINSIILSFIIYRKATNSFVVIRIYFNNLVTTG